MSEQEQLVVELARALHESGAPAHRLENTITEICATLGLQVACFSTPTSLFLDFGSHARLLRVEPGDVHLERMVELSSIGDELLRQDIRIEEARARLARMREAPGRYGTVTTVLAYGLVSGCAGVFFGTGLAGIGVAVGLGLLTGLLNQLLQGDATARLMPLASSFSVAALATLAGRLVAIPIPLVTIAGIVVLLPGLTVVVGLTELASRHLASGSARLAGAGVLFLQLGLGCAVGWRVSSFLPRSIRFVTEPASDLALLLALLLVPFSYLVLFRARPRDLWVITLMGAVAFYTSRLGTHAMGPELGAAMGGLLVGLLSNLQSRLRSVPSAVAQLPGLLLLVPGSMGFRGLGALIQDDINTGISLSLSMVLIALGLASGLLAASVILPERVFQPSTSPDTRNSG